ncbi:monooxygenase [Mesorhizobium sp. L-8-10]|nr:monooxygenase [Mesorhizobium sp. L-8-10]
MTDIGTMAVGILMSDVGVHPAAWRHPSTPAAGETSFAFLLEVARLAEAGKCDFVFLADSLATRTGNMNSIRRQSGHIAHLEPITAISALAAGTNRIGLAATISTTYSEPYNVARQFASLDHISNGRAAWNAVTTADAAAARNFGRETHEDHAQRYRRAGEFVDVLNGLWDSWTDEAFIRDRESGVFFDPDQMRAPNHKGEFYQVGGPLNVPRPPQGRPVAISAGGSEPGRELAARTSEVVFSVNRDLATAKEFYQDLKGRMAKYNRQPDELRILTSLNPYIGRTESEAEDKFSSLQTLIHPDVGRAILAVDLGVDLSSLDVDQAIPLELLPETSNSTRSYFDMMVAAVRDERLTVRQLYERCAAARGGMNPVVGSANTVADHMEKWFREGACDGFMVRVPYLPTGLQDFVELVVPELQRRGLYRTDYEGKTLRDHLRLARPAVLS